MSSPRGMPRAAGRAARLGLITSFRALERSAGRRHLGPASLTPRSFFMAALPLFEYLVFEDAGGGGSAPHLMRDVDPHLVLAGRSCWRDDSGQLQIRPHQLSRPAAAADNRYHGACFWQAGDLPLYVPYTGESRVEACAPLGITIRAHVHP